MSAIWTGLSGLRAHETMLDVIGNNLANVNTIGFKGSRVSFSDVLGETLSLGAAPTDSLGGVNPRQVGNGVGVAAIQRDFSQGSMIRTGNEFDVAIQGDGFVVLSDNVQDYYMRTGTLAADSSGSIVDSFTGMWVRGVNGQKINVSSQSSLPGNSTSVMNITGNLDASAGPPAAQVLTSISPLQASSAAATAATELNDLDSTTVSYADGDKVRISGTGQDGQPFTPVDFIYGATSNTLGDLLTSINTALSGEATAALDASGNIVLTAASEGESSISLMMENLSGTGVTTWSNHSCATTTEGTPGDSAATSIEVFDGQGNGHVLTLTFTKGGANLWDMTAAMDSSDGTVTDGKIDGVLFQSDGSFQTILGSGEGDAGISIKFNGFDSAQNITVGFGAPGAFSGLTQYGGATSAAASSQDGYSAGSLESMSIGSDGRVTGLYTNGQNSVLGQIGLTVFDNPRGLRSVGDNLWQPSGNTGDKRMLAPQSGDAGAILSSSLENSNVDSSQELIQLIIAQRGYQLSARTISIGQSTGQEVANIVR